ncbi:DNA-directed RNA polymerase subunit beta [Nocardia sp. JCM 34519.1]|uniref:DNA-directed RNA polymerase subunit beta n=1 Tax=Nocardia sp. JCM 34519.1 TaxID=2876119 RepID=UPI001CE49075|nr:DNA-directed RNA polymerase subunit beta [Nocardia sp. JCM 34519.1]
MDDSQLSDTTRSRCAYYRNICGIPAGIDAEFDRIIVRAGVVGAIAMPAELGTRVQDAMRHNRRTLGPIVSHSKSGRWTFLVRPDLSTEDIRLFAETFRINVSVAPVGGEIVLPSPADDLSGRRRWVVPPLDTFRPSGAIVMEYVRKCARLPNDRTAGSP